MLLQHGVDDAGVDHLEDGGDDLGRLGGDDDLEEREHRADVDEARDLGRVDEGAGEEVGEEADDRQLLRGVGAGGEAGEHGHQRLLVEGECVGGLVVRLCAHQVGEDRERLHEDLAVGVFQQGQELRDQSGLLEIDLRLLKAGDIDQGVQKMELNERATIADEGHQRVQTARVKQDLHVASGKTPSSQLLDGHFENGIRNTLGLNHTDQRIQRKLRNLMFHRRFGRLFWWNKSRWCKWHVLFYFNFFNFY